MALTLRVEATMISCLSPYIVLIEDLKPVNSCTDRTVAGGLLVRRTQPAQPDDNVKVCILCGRNDFQALSPFDSASRYKCLWPLSKVKL